MKLIEHFFYKKEPELAGHYYKFYLKRNKRSDSEFRFFYSEFKFIGLKEITPDIFFLLKEDMKPPKRNKAFLSSRKLRKSKGKAIFDQKKLESLKKLKDWENEQEKVPAPLN